MRYSDSRSLNATYEVIARLLVIEFQEATSAERGMTISAALGELGEDRTWASVWWAYGAIHYDLSDEALRQALDLLVKVDASPEARAAALMLWAEIKLTQAIHSDSEPDQQEQTTALAEAVALAPMWPSIRVRLARALQSSGENELARMHAEKAVAITQAEPSSDPFDIAITGTGLASGWAAQELSALKLLET